MSETQPPKDLTAQLAQWVLVEWTRAHNNCSLWNRSGSARCDGTFAGCNFPKLAALVAYEQGHTSFPSSSPDAGHDHVQALPKYRSMFFCDHANESPRGGICRCPADCGCRERMCYHASEMPHPRLRADGAGEPVKPALAYVLTRGDMPNRWYASEARAQQDLELANGADNENHWHYRVHAVPMVE